MHRRYLFVLPVVLGLAGFVRDPLSDSTLSVSVSCNNNGGGTFGCYAFVSGGTGVYTNYAWRVTETQPLQPNMVRSWSTSEPQVYDTCTIGYMLNVSVTVTDSQGATGTDNMSTNCTMTAD